MQAIYSDPEMLQVLNGNVTASIADFEPPPGLEQRSICDISSVVVNTTECRPQGSEWFLQVETPDEANPTPLPPPGEEVVEWEKLDPAVWRIPAVYLAPELLQIASTDQFEDGLPPQYFCHFRRGSLLVDLPPETANQLFLQPPRNPESLEAAYEWAFERSLAMLPAEPCSEELLVISQPSGNGIFRITSPKANEEVSGVISIEGVASFDPSIVQFYKVELEITTDQWVTLGETHREPVAGGILEQLHTPSLPPGDYRLRLVGVMWDGNFATEPPVVPFTILGN
jgi:hypothetical protein